jgi:two-component system chemotaxis response regulator CheY
MRILIVDDDKISRELLFSVSSGYGKCDLAIDGIEAIEAFGFAYEEGMPYDVMLLDIMMPLIEGNKVLKKIRAFEGKNKIAKDKKVKVVIVSALYNPKLVEELSTYEIYEYIRKPVNLDLLKKVFNSLI